MHLLTLGSKVLYQLDGYDGNGSLISIIFHGDTYMILLISNVYIQYPIWI